MNKHTPGPWKFIRTHLGSINTWYVITDNQGYGPIFEVGGKDCDGQVAEAKYLITDPQIIEANAALIAAAPTMYADLCAVQDYLFELYDEGNAKAGEYAASLGITIEQAEGQHHE